VWEVTRFIGRTCCILQGRFSRAQGATPSNALELTGRTASAVPIFAAVLVAAGLLTLCACGAEFVKPIAIAWEPVTPASLAAARSRWAAAGIEVYDYSPRCEVWIHGDRIGDPEPLVIVHQGVVSRSNLNLVSDSNFLRHAGPLTIEGIFNLLEQAMNKEEYRSGARSLTAVLDPATGIPFEIRDDNNGMYDDWEYCAVRSFRVWKRHGESTAEVRSASGVHLQ
jgi:hypothetical protein